MNNNRSYNNLTAGVPMSEPKLDLSAIEAQAVYNRERQPHLVKGQALRAFNRAIKKLELYFCACRRYAIWQKGYEDANKLISTRATFEGRSLGSLETFTYLRGYNWAKLEWQTNKMRA